MAWRDLAGQLDRAVVRTFDYGGVTFQKMNGAAPVGDPVALPAEYDGAYLQVTGEDMTGGTRKPSFAVHYADFPNGVRPASGDRIIVAAGEAAGTYEIDHPEEDADRVGAILIVRRL